MDSRGQVCHNAACPDRGQAGRGNIRVHSRKERRYRCRTYTRTFAETKGTPYYRPHKATGLLTTVLTLLSHGCPRQAIVAAFGLTDHPWSLHELLTCPVPGAAPKRRGRRPTWLLDAARAA